jgi:hypothetical protein
MLLGNIHDYQKARGDWAGSHSCILDQRREPYSRIPQFTMPYTQRLNSKCTLTRRPAAHLPSVRIQMELDHGNMVPSTELQRT